MKNSKTEAIHRSVAQKIRDKAVTDGLSAIYHDDDGRLIDVKKVTIKNKRGWLYWSVVSLIISILTFGAYLGARQLLKNGVNTDAIGFTITADKQPVAGQEFTLLVDYQNNNRLAIDNAQAHLTYPDELIYVDSQPRADVDNNTWKLGALPAGAHGQLKIKVKLIAEIGKNSLVTGEFRYNPTGFSTEFKKSAELNLSLTDTGLDIALINLDSVMVGDKQKVVVKYRARQPYLDNFRLVVEPANPNNVEFIADAQKSADIQLIKPWVWQVNKVTDQDQELVIYYKLINKVADRQTMDFKFSYRSADNVQAPAGDVEISHPVDSYYLFQTNSLDLEVVNNSLNLLLLINGSDKDQGVDFGQTLNYSLSYGNKGQSPVDNVSFTATLDSDLIDWSTVKDKNHGLIKNNTITWSSEQIPALATLAKDSVGAIDFSVKLKEAGNDLKTDQIKSYGEFQIGSGNDLATLIKNINDRQAGNDSATTTVAATADNNNQSNIVINKVNSDFRVNQSVLYFNEDNIPVGAGPLPLEVNKTTSLRVFWTVKNSFHDLNNVKVVVKLPDYATWPAKTNLSAGQIRYDEANRQVIWEAQNLSQAMGGATADFSLDFKPRLDQRNQIIVLLPPCEATANDNVTGSSIRRLGKVKTSKLEDDGIVKSVNLDASSGLIK